MGDSGDPEWEKFCKALADNDVERMREIQSQWEQPDLRSHNPYVQRNREIRRRFQRGDSMEEIAHDVNLSVSRLRGIIFSETE